MENEEKQIGVYFLFFQLLEINEKKRMKNEKENAETVFGLPPKLYCERRIVS